MPRRSNLELLDLIERAYELAVTYKKTSEEIADLFRDEGYAVSKSGVARALRNKKRSMKEYEESLQEADAIVKATAGTPGTQVGEAAMAVVMTKLLREIKCIEDFRDMDSEQLISATAKIARATASVGRLHLDYEKGYKAGLFAAAKKVGEEAKARGLSDANAEEIKNKIMGLGSEK